MDFIDSILSVQFGCIKMNEIDKNEWNWQKWMKLIEIYGIDKNLWNWYKLYKLYKLLMIKTLKIIIWSYH